MLNELIRHFKGYLRIRVSGNSIERFINTCSYKGINLWDLSSKNSVYEMNITIKDFKKLKPVIRKTRTKVRILKRAGFPFFIQKYNQRKILFLGAFLSIYLIFILSTHIWSINISGNSMYTNEIIIDFLNSINIEKGMKKNEIDCKKITRMIRQKYNDIIWVSASLEGSNLNIKIKENEDSKNVNETDGTIIPYDIAANVDCKITKLVIRNGIPNVKQGDLIKKGDLLILGQIPIYNDAKEIISYQYCKSDADIYGEKQIYYQDELPLISNKKIYHNVEKHEYFLKIGKYRISLGSINNNYEHYESYTKQKKLNEIVCGARNVLPYTTENKYYTDEEIRTILTENFQYYCRELEKKGVVILQNDVKIYTWSDKAKATGTLTIEMPIGQKVKSEIIEIGDNIDGNDGNNN